MAIPFNDEFDTMTFYCRLNAPRPDFGATMNETEMQIMGKHAEYWHAAIARGEGVGFGAVMSAEGFFGVGIVECPAEPDARAFTSNDPVILANMGFSYDVSMMPLGFTCRESVA